MHTCNKCGTTFTRRYSLIRHHDRGRCKNARDGSLSGEKENLNSLYSQQQKVIPTMSGEYDSHKVKKNPRFQTLVDEIINDGITYSQPPSSLGNFEKAPALKKIKLASYEDNTKTPPLLRETVVEKRPLSPVPLIDPPVTIPSVTKEYLPDYSDDDDQSSSSDDGTIDISDIPPPDNVKFLPATIDGLRTRFEELLKNIAVLRKSGGHEKTGDRHETVFLLDELKRQGGISRCMYRQYNDFLAESPPVLGSGIVSGSGYEEKMDTSEELSSEDDLKKEIASTIDYLIEHDKKELLESVKEIEKDDEEIIDTVTELEELITVYLQDEFLDRESVAEKVLEILNRLSKSKHIPKSRLLKIKMLLNDITKNRARVREIVARFIQAGDDSKNRLWIIEQLAKEKLLSEEQYFKLAEIVDAIDIKQLTDVIRETKIGQGMNFLPRKTGQLLDNLREWMQEFLENGGTVLQSKISSVLNELFQRKKITEERYNELKEQHDIL